MTSGAKRGLAVTLGTNSIWDRSTELWKPWWNGMLASTLCRGRRGAPVNTTNSRGLPVQPVQPVTRRPENTCHRVLEAQVQLTVSVVCEFEAPANVLTLEIFFTFTTNLHSLGVDGSHHRNMRWTNIYKNADNTSDGDYERHEERPKRDRERHQESSPEF
jgi:hypothetical protein